jgi:hypothetical protein
MHEGYRVLHAAKGIRIDHEALVTQVAWKASSPLVQECGGRFSLFVRDVALRVCRGRQRLRQRCRAGSQILPSSFGIQTKVIPP